MTKFFLHFFPLFTIFLGCLAVVLLVQYMRSIRKKAHPVVMIMIVLTMLLSVPYQAAFAAMVARVLGPFAGAQGTVAGARTQSIVLCSRLEGFEADIAETLLAPGRPYFEYWGHEACWLPLSLYPHFAFRRKAFAGRHPWWGDLLERERRHGRDIDTQRIDTLRQAGAEAQHEKAAIESR